jgi:hypothetical protein
MMKLMLIALLIIPATVSANESSRAHSFCMAMMREGPAQALNERFKPLTRNEEEWDRLVSVVLETWHEACFSLLGVPDNRVGAGQMPWVSPGMICEERP